jgi:PAZ domain
MAGIRSAQGLSQYFLENPGRFFQACGKLLDMYFTVKHLQPHQNAKKIKFSSWATKDARETTFDEQVDQNTTHSTSVVDYYLRKYSIRLQFPELPLAHTRHGDFPLELCFSAAGK